MAAELEPGGGGHGLKSLFMASWDSRVGMDAAQERCGRILEGGLCTAKRVHETQNAVCIGKSQFHCMLTQDSETRNFMNS